MTHPQLGEIECVQSPRARNISIRVKPSGAVRLGDEAFAFLIIEVTNPFISTIIISPSNTNQFPVFIIFCPKSWHFF